MQGCILCHVEFPIEHRLCDNCGEISVITEEGRSVHIERWLRYMKSGEAPPTYVKFHGDSDWVSYAVTHLDALAPLTVRLKAFAEFVRDGRKFPFYGSGLSYISLSLERISDPAVTAPLLIESLYSWQAQGVLMRMGKSALPYLRDFASSNDPRLRDKDELNYPLIDSVKYCILRIENPSKWFPLREPLRT